MLAAGAGIMLWPRSHPGYRTAFWLWAGGIVAYVLSFRRAERALTPPPASVQLGLIGILALAAALRLVAIEDIPANISIDEILPSLEALHIAQGGAPNVFSSVGWFGMPTLTFSFAAVVMRFAGPDAFLAARLSSVLMGISGIACLFLLARRLFGDRVALVASFFMAISFWHIHNSRTGFPFVQSSLWPSLTLYLLVRARQGRSRAALALAGVTLGLALQCYFPVRILLLLCPLFWLADWLRNPVPVRTMAADTATFLVATLVVVAPLLLSAPWESIAGHSRGVLLCNSGTLQHLADLYKVTGLPAVFGRNLQEAAAMFTDWADVCVMNRSPAGLLDTGTLVALVIGVLAAVLQGETAALLLVVWAALTFVLGVAFSDAPRASYRLAPAMPALLILAAFGVDRALLAVTPPWRWYRLTVRPVVIAGIGLWLLAQNYHLFFVDYAKGDGRENADSAVRRLAVSECDGRTFYFVGDWLAMNATVSQQPHALDLFCPDHQSVAAGEIPGRIGTTRPATFLILLTDSRVTDTLRRCYPSAQITMHRSRDGRPLFTSVDVSVATLVSGRSCPAEAQVP
ncbi:MAG: ArnT family glycosyltransferase [Candidatus Binatia bacterium]